MKKHCYVGSSALNWMPPSPFYWFKQLPMGESDSIDLNTAGINGFTLRWDSEHTPQLSGLRESCWVISLEWPVWQNLPQNRTFLVSVFFFLSAKCRFDPWEFPARFHSTGTMFCQRGECDTCVMPDFRHAGTIFSKGLTVAKGWEQVESHNWAKLSWDLLDLAMLERIMWKENIKASTVLFG